MERPLTSDWNAKDAVASAADSDLGRLLNGTRSDTAAPGGSSAKPKPAIRKLLTPSFSDLFFISLILWLFVGGDGWQGLLLDADSGWHIRTGEYILDHREIPVRDLYSYSKPDAPWYAWEWLADVTDALLFRAFGLKGVVLLAGVIIALTAVILVRHMFWRGANAFAAVAVSLMAMSAASIHFFARPHVFTLLFTVVSLRVLDGDMRRETRVLWLMIPLCALWTNLHGGFLILIACAGLAAIGEAIAALLEGGWGAWAGWRWKKASRYGLVAAGCAAASLVNPYGFHLHQHIFEYLRSDWIKNVIQEFQSPSFRSENMVHFELLMIVAVTSIGAMVRRLEITGALWILFFLHNSLAAARHVPLFVLATGPLVASEITRWWNRVAAGQPKKSIAGILDDIARTAGEGFRWTSLWPVAFVAAMVLMNDPWRWPKDYPDFGFPTAMIHREQSVLNNSRVFTSDQWADYLLFAGYPRQKVFFDGRSDFYGSGIGTDYVTLMLGQYGWEKLFSHYGFTAALIPVQWPLSSLLKTRQDWKVIEDDGKALLFVIRKPGRSGEGDRPVPKDYGVDKKETLSLMKSTDPAELFNGDSIK